MSSPSNSCVPARAPVQPGNRVDERALAGAVGADHAQQLAFADAQRHVPQRGRRAVGDRASASSSMGRSQDTRRPRRAAASRRAARLRPAPRRDSAPRGGRTAPSPRASRARRTRWSRPGRGCGGSTRPPRRSPTGVRPDNTSSSISTCGRDASARANSRNLRWCRLSFGGQRIGLVARGRRRPATAHASRCAVAAIERCAAEHRRQRHVLAAP